MNTQKTFVETRKRSLENANNELYQEKRGFFQTVKNFILHPIDSLTPKTKNISTITLEIFEKNKGEVELKLKENKKEKDTVRLIEHSNIDNEIDVIKQNVESLIKQALTKTSAASSLVPKPDSVIQQNSFVRPNDADDEKSVVVIEEKKEENVTDIPVENGEEKKEESENKEQNE